MGILTDRQVQLSKLPDGMKERYLADGNGLCLRLRAGKDTAAQKKHWVLRYMMSGVAKKHGLGAYPLVSLAVARDLAVAANRKIQAGIDPIESKATAAAIRHADTVAQSLGDHPQTVAELGATWLSQYAAKKHTDKSYSAAVFKNHIDPVLGKLRLELLRAKHVSGLLDAIHSRGASRTCGVVLSTLRQAIKWGMAREYIAGDITAGLKGSEWGGKGQMRDRTLKDGEIMLLHHLVENSSLTPRWKHGIWLILSTGTRVEETLLAEVAHVDLEKNEWRIPVENQKKVNGNAKPAEHIVHLSPFARAQMLSLVALADGGQGRFLFPSRVQKDDVEQPANEKTLTHVVTDRQTDEPKTGRTQQSDELALPGGHWTPHDLRRTLSTQMGELGVASDVIDRCINHVTGDLVKQTYHLQLLRAQMQDAWTIWSDKLSSLIAQASADTATRNTVKGGIVRRLAKQELDRKVRKQVRTAATAKLDKKKESL